MMNRQNLNGARYTTTVAFQAPSKPQRETPPRLQMDLRSWQHNTAEVFALLRQRLRLAGAIALAAFAVFLLRYLLSLEDQPASILGLHSLVVVVLTLVSVLLWSRLRFTMFGLRTVELLMFGSMALYFAYVQYWTFHLGNVLSWADKNHFDRIVSLAVAGNSLRWFVLIVLYGTFIPNTWRRCAAIVSTLALGPLLLHIATCWTCAVMGPYAVAALFEMCVILGVGGAIALFGSYKINILQKEAWAVRRLGQYRLHRKLGAGGMGEVYLGEHVLLDRPCAIKLIDSKRASDPTTLLRFEREVQAMAKLTHWNTVEIFDYGRDEEGTFYYVMEYLPGMTLQELVQRTGPLEPARAVHFLRQICASLREAHAMGLIHRDIKPANVIVCRRGGVYDVAKLLDFGLVYSPGVGMEAHQLSLYGAILGSPPYMSPEQALSKDLIDARTDIYSLGALAYFLLTGQPPFLRDTPVLMMIAHVRDSVRPPTGLQPELPLDIQDIVLRCLNKDPQKRFVDVENLDRELAASDCADQWNADQAAEWWQAHTIPGQDH